MAQGNDISRRGILKLSGIGLAALGAGSLLGNSIADICTRTPKQPEGPFYPVRDQNDKNTDLTLVEGKTEMALGQILYVSGVVQDQNCQPIRGVVVEIWQACATGRYNHPGDEENPNPLDPNFQYWGIAATNAEGQYSFKTIIPGHYEAAPGWIRPPHLHYKVHKRGYRELITQMYFSGNQYNEGDRILRAVPRADWHSVVRDLRALPSENNRETFAINFDISLERIL